MSSFWFIKVIDFDDFYIICMTSLIRTEWCSILFYFYIYFTAAYFMLRFGTGAKRQVPNRSTSSIKLPYYVSGHESLR